MAKKEGAFTPRNENDMKIDNMHLMLRAIDQKEPEVINVLYEVIQHIHGTYDDKYQGDDSRFIDTKALLLSKSGKIANIHSASKYIQRYSTTGFEKSENPIDLKKSIHYLIFEIQRRLKHGKTV